MNRRVSLAIATAAATVMTMAVPAVAEEVTTTTSTTAAATPTAEATLEETTQEQTTEPTEDSSSGSADSLGSADVLGSSGTTDDAAPETDTGLDEDGLCPNGEIPEYPALDPEEEPAKDTFLGPYALFEELTGSSIPGKSTDSPNGADEFGCTSEQQMDPEDYPEWMRSSLFPSEDVKMIMAVVEALLIVGMTATQVAAVVVPFVPGARQELRDVLTSLGVTFDA